MTLYSCWLADEGETEDGATLMDKSLAAWAAEAFAEHAYHESCGELGGSFSVTVRAADGPAEIFDVEANWSPTFTASRRREP